ncbi:putative MFS family arabinose efflux permease [Gibbsiella quercinecans]|uniref:MFS transporter n=1 Tax=Gibbsiella quercinecans TaxID=929813 RepID=A0A250B4C8_9GAMM|nr:MFS transporter [Gibbsiella quercinecans]ATA21090.1 MFS transporter [Gibbsiella quercinecans]RLM08461.1 MFS transporter [Gibbsiella quercinecans]RLM11736.1 MFS transporter [Gibbsiella quercinecans]TCT86726.1 putative MFS family arabinose efflux permease [Gibbsiella quercinecans]
MRRKDHTHPGIYALAIGAFAIGVAEFIVVGVLPAIAAEFSVPLASAGGLVGLYAFALAIGTPLVVLALARLPRKTVLLGLVALFLAGNLLSALSASYPMLLAGRSITAVAHGSFFAIGATIAARLAPEGQASRAIAVMFAGLNLAMVVGVPLGSFIGNSFGWRLPFFAVALLAGLAWLAAARWVPNLPTLAAARGREQLAALRQPAVLAMMSITALGFGASFAAFTFITPILVDISGFSLHSASLLLVVFGAATLVGNLLGGRLAASLGWPLALRRMFAGLLVVFAALALLMTSKTAMVPLLFIWGVFAFGMSPGFQTGMLDTAERWAPRAVDFASALNISAFNLGITLGQACGSTLVAQGQLAHTPWAGFALALLAQLPLLWLARRHRCHVGRAGCR